MLLCTLNVTNPYTDIPHNEGIQAIKEMLAIHRPPHDLPHCSYIVEQLEVVLTNNYFEFNGTHYHQVSGTAMSTKLAPSYANLFMTKFEEKYVYTCPLQPAQWKRFIDDIFLIWPHEIEPLKEFINHLNKVHPTIKFTSKISSSQIPFLDLMIYIKDKKLHTRLYTRSSDRHMYLNYNSELPMSLKKSIPYSQFLRLMRIHLLEAEIHMYLFFSMERISPKLNFEEMRTSKFNVKGAIVDSQKSLVKQRYHSCSSLFLTPILRKLYPNIGPTWADLVPLENWDSRIS